MKKKADHDLKQLVKIVKNYFVIPIKIFYFDLEVLVGQSNCRNYKDEYGSSNGLSITCR